MRTSIVDQYLSYLSPFDIRFDDDSVVEGEIDPFHVFLREINRHVHFDGSGLAVTRFMVHAYLFLPA